MKKIVAISLLVGAMGIVTGCSEHDVTYYQSNIEEAKNKNESCKKAMMDAFKEQDEDRLISIQEDAECRAASKVYREHQREIANLEREKMRAEAEQKRLEAKKKFDEEYKKYLANYQQMDIYTLFKQKADCAVFVMSQSAKCKAFKQAYDSNMAQEVESMINQESEFLDSLITKSCSGIGYNEVKCEVAKDALRAKRKKTIENYITNRNRLKVDFNQCVEKYHALRKNKKFNDAQRYLRTFKCSTVGEAARKLRVYSFSKPIS